MTDKRKRQPERHTALIDSLAAELFPFQESEEEQESFTDVGRQRVDEWISALLIAQAAHLKALEQAIRDHRDAKADDRCIDDDDRLYAVLGDGVKCDRRVGDKAAMLANCARFIDKRCEGGGWRSYVELEHLLSTQAGDLERVHQENEALRRHVAARLSLLITMEPLDDKAKLTQFHRLNELQQLAQLFENAPENATSPRAEHS